MQFEVSSQADVQNWEQTGQWFNDFVQLGFNLERISKLEPLRLERILLAVPRKEFVSIAISLGVSINKLINRSHIPQEILIKDLEKIPIDSMLRMQFTKGGFIDGKLRNYDSKRKTILFLTEEKLGNNYVEKRRLNSIENVIDRIYLLPAGYPIGTYEKLKEIGVDTRSMTRKEFWQIQASPGLLIFTDQKNFENQLNGKIRHQSLNEFIESTQNSIKQATRTTSFLQHRNPSFINSYAGTSEINTCISSERDRFNLFEWIILDGNNAMTRLAAKEEMLGKRILSVLELGVPRSQSKALESFSSELNNFRAIDIVTVLNWKPPHGVNIWGWSR